MWGKRTHKTGGQLRCEQEEQDAQAGEDLEEEGPSQEQSEASQDSAAWESDLLSTAPVKSYNVALKEGRALNDLLLRIP